MPNVAACVHWSLREEGTLDGSTVSADVKMDPAVPPDGRLNVDVDLGFALFFVLVLCFFLLVAIVRCAQLVLDPYSAVSVSTYQEEHAED